MENQGLNLIARTVAIALMAVMMGILLPAVPSVALPPAIGWESGHATFYGNPDGSGMDGGNCGYGPLVALYGRYVSAVSIVLYQNGKGCGGCFQVKCVDNPHCTGKTVQVTATDQCPDGGYCDAGKNHFDLSQPAFRMIAAEVAGVIPVVWRRVQCARNGPIQLKVSGNPFWFSLLIKNSGGDGDVGAVSIKPANKGTWYNMIHLWGQVWLLSGFMMPIRGPISVRIVTLQSGQVLTGQNCIPNGWVSERIYSMGAQLGQQIASVRGFNSGSNK